MSIRSTVHSLIGSKAGLAGIGLIVALAIPGCHRTAAAGQSGGSDPADANFAPVNGSAPAATPVSQPAQVLGQRSASEPQQQAEEYSQAAPPPGSPAYPQQGDAPYPQQGYPDQGYPQQGYPNQGYAPSPEDAAADAYSADLTSEASSEPPPPLPDYEQPPAPDPNYLWTPGYWAWGPAGYYWVPGVWVAAPYTGALWTPGYWGFAGNMYRFHHGFWGMHIGFYGGIDYGYGYTGYGYYGGYWNGGHFFYNTAVNRINVNAIHNVYVRNVMVNNQVVNNRILNRVSFNGGRGGVDVRPRPAELAVLHEQRIPPMQSQMAVRQEAAGNRAQFFNQNHGRPQVMAAARPIAADRSLPAALPRPATGAAIQNGNREAFRPGAPQPGNNPATRGFAGQAGPAARNGQVDNRGFAPGQHPESPRAVEPQGVVRPIQPSHIQQLPNGQAQPNGNRQPYRAQPQPQPQAQPQQQRQWQQQQRQPQGEQRPQAPQPQSQQRQQPQPQQRQEPQPQQRQQSQPQERQQSQPQAQQHPQPQNHAAPPPRNEHDDRGH